MEPLYICTCIYYDGIVRLLTKAEDPVMARSNTRIWLVDHTGKVGTKPKHIICDRVPESLVAVYVGERKAMQSFDFFTDERRVHDGHRA